MYENKRCLAKLQPTRVLQNTGYRITPISICNSIQLLYFGRSKSKVTAKRATGMRMPVLRKAQNVVGNPTDCFINTTMQFFTTRPILKYGLISAIFYWSITSLLTLAVDGTLLLLSFYTPGTIFGVCLFVGFDKLKIQYRIMLKLQQNQESKRSYKSFVIIRRLNSAIRDATKNLNKERAEK